MNPMFYYFLTMYAGVALLFLGFRALSCITSYRHFDFSIELLAAMVWWLSSIYWIWYAIRRCKQYPRPW